MIFVLLLFSYTYQLNIRYISEKYPDFLKGADRFKQIFTRILCFHGSKSCSCSQSKMGRKRRQAADYAADQPDSLEVVKKTRMGETTECLRCGVR